jgi:hypothetical protein
MPRRDTWRWAALPILSVPLYLWTAYLLPPMWVRVVASEQGPIEIGTAVLFLAAVFVAVSLCRDTAKLPRLCRLFFAGFAAGSAFVALEEVSYGQHLFFWGSPEWFQEHNAQGETNLHNALGNTLSDLLRTIASVGYPLFFAVLPLVCLRLPQVYHPGRWAYYLLPRTELIALVVIAQFITLPHKLPRDGDSLAWTYRLGEVKELYWAIATYAYVRLISRRVSSPGAVESSAEPLPTVEPRRLAA